MKITKGMNTRVIEEPVVHLEMSPEEAQKLGHIANVCLYMLHPDPEWTTLATKVLNDLAALAAL